MGSLNVAIIGCGNIADAYAKTMKPHESIRLIGATDIDRERAAEFTSKYGGRHYLSLEEILADKAVDIVVNLTSHTAHVGVIRASLEAGKHVYTEKPLAMTYADAKELVELAEKRKLTLASSPITYLGESQQLSGKLIREGKLGAVRLIHAEMHNSRIEIWHPRPQGFYDVGALFDVGLYPITLVTAFLGPVVEAQAAGTILKRDRVAKDGTPFVVTAPDWVSAVLTLESGARCRMTTSFYVDHFKHQNGVEFHGDDGSIHLASTVDFDSLVEHAKFGEKYAPLPPAAHAYRGTEWSRGLVDLSNSLMAGTKPIAQARHALHVIEILESISRSISMRAPVALQSRFDVPPLLGSGR